MTEQLVDNCLDTYAHELTRIDVLGPNRRLVFTVPDPVNPGYAQVTSRLILPADVMVTLAYMAAGAHRAQVSLDLLAFQPRIAN
jgi:hypothetical protein